MRIPHSPNVQAALALAECIVESRPVCFVALSDGAPVERIPCGDALELDVEIVEPAPALG